jgi:hypothetical protein
MYLSIVFFAYLKIALRVIAYGTYIGSLGSNNDVTAVAAFPYLDSALFKYLGSLHIFKQCTVALLVMLFNSAYSSELCGKLCKALFLGGLGKLLVHICPLVVLAVSGSAEIFGSVSDAVKLPLNHIFACSFSLSAVLRKRAAICSKPSFLAFEAKYVYLFLACDSPANAA